jgi:hypothetical protein
MSLPAHVGQQGHQDRKAHREKEAHVVYKVNKELKAIPGQRELKVIQGRKGHKVSQVVQLVHLVIHREIWLSTIPVGKPQSALA